MSAIEGAVVAPFPGFIHPMLASDDVPAYLFKQEGMTYQPKFDGHRVIVEVKDGEVKIYSRGGYSYTNRFSPIAAKFQHVEKNMLVDAEMVVFVDRRHNLQNISRYGIHNRVGTPTLIAFDLLHLGTESLLGAPLSERHETLASVLRQEFPESHSVLLVPGGSNGAQLFEDTHNWGMEGIVAKKLSSPYVPGKRGKKGREREIRTRYWYKLKHPDYVNHDKEPKKTKKKS